MAVPQLEFTPVRARRGRKVHATCLASSTTACGKKFSGWLVEPRKLNCQECIAAVFYPVEIVDGD